MSVTEAQGCGVFGSLAGQTWVVVTQGLLPQIQVWDSAKQVCSFSSWEEFSFSVSMTTSQGGLTGKPGREG